MKLPIIMSSVILQTRALLSGDKEAPDLAVDPICSNQQVIADRFTVLIPLKADCPVV